jgi:hypothetical protein
LQGLDERFDATYRWSSPYEDNNPSVKISNESSIRLNPDMPKKEKPRRPRADGVFYQVFFNSRG